ncbi:MAG: TonB family protein [Thermodesulfobacteriota bacterium]
MKRGLVWAGLASLTVHWGLFQIPWSVDPAVKRDQYVSSLELTLVERTPQRTLPESLPSPVAMEPFSPPEVVPDDISPPRGPVAPPKAPVVDRRAARAVNPPPRDTESPKVSAPAAEIPEVSSEGFEGPPLEFPSASREKEEGPAVAKALEEPPPAPHGDRPAVRLQRALPRYDLNPKPMYPETARRRGYEGTVVVTARVLKDGSAADIRVGKGSGHELLDKAAIQAVRSWRFIPGTLDDEPVEMEVDIPIRFQLE